MAKETKTIYVDRSEKDETIDFRQIFGWELFDVEEVHLVEKVTEITYHISITLQRDKSIPNYAELCDLERQYYALVNYSYPPAPIKKDASGHLRILTTLIFGALTTTTSLPARTSVASLSCFRFVTSGISCLNHD